MHWLSNISKSRSILALKFSHYGSGILQVLSELRISRLTSNCTPTYPEELTYGFGSLFQQWNLKPKQKIKELINLDINVKLDNKIKL